MTSREPCRLLVHPPSDGAWNMAVDELLLDRASQSQSCCLRFYQWSRPTLSLGYFQEYADRALHPASAACAVVRRSTGGGAILHDRELTYSFTVPARHRLAADAVTLYRRLHTTLLRVLASRNVSAALCNPPTPGGTGECSFLCFQRRSDGDLVVGSTKICGSAQRRRRGAILQHGSVLLSRAHDAPELPGLAEVTHTALSHSDLIELWQPELARVLDLDWIPDELTLQERDSAAEIVRAKHAHPGWIERR